MNKIYKVDENERISRNVTLGTGANTNELYDLETDLKNAIEYVCKWRERNLGNDYWKEALPQTLFTILDIFDNDAGLAASRSFIKKFGKD